MNKWILTAATAFGVLVLVLIFSTITLPLIQSTIASAKPAADHNEVGARLLAAGFRETSRSSPLGAEQVTYKREYAGGDIVHITVCYAWTSIEVSVPVAATDNAERIHVAYSEGEAIITLVTADSLAVQSLKDDRNQIAVTEGIARKAYSANSGNWKIDAAYYLNNTNVGGMVKVCHFNLSPS